MGYTHACLRSMTPCQNIKCMLWLLSQMCVRFFKSIDSGWINGNRGIFFFPPVQKGGDNTLQRGTRQGRQESVLCEEALLTPLATRALWEAGAGIYLSCPPAVAQGDEGPSSAPPGTALHSVHPALTLTPTEDNSTLSLVPEQIQPAPPSKYDHRSPHSPVLPFLLLPPGPPATWIIISMYLPHTAARQLPSRPE